MALTAEFLRWKHHVDVSYRGGAALLYCRPTIENKPNKNKNKNARLTLSREAKEIELRNPVLLSGMRLPNFDESKLG